MNFRHSFSRLIFFASVFNLSCAYYYVVMRAETTTSSKDFCVYSEKPPALSKEVDEVKPHFLETDSAVNWCAHDSQTDSSDKKVLLLPSGKCSLSSQIQNFHDTGGKVVLFVNNRSVNYMNFMESDYLNGTGIPAMKISRSSAKKLKEMGETVTVRLFKPRQIQYVYFYVILVAVAVMIAIVGALTSGHATYQYFTEKVTKKGIDACEEPPVKGIHIENVQHLKVWLKIQHRFRWFVGKLGISIEVGLFAFLLTSCFLVFWITASAFATTMGYSLNGYYDVYWSVLTMLVTVICVSVCLDSWTINYRSYNFKYSFTIGKSTLTIPVLSLILNSMAFGLTAAWVYFQDTKYACLFQNLIFMFFCFGYLRLFQLPSLKVVTIVLLFFVTIDTVIAYTSSHSNEDDLNYMEDVPTGRKYDKLMKNIVFNDFGLFDVGACFPVRVFMGVGDIIVPGFLLAYCCAFDLCSSSKRTYYLFTSVIFFGIGMILTMLVKEFWNPEEPTLILTVPTILIPIVLLGWCRGELNALWNGFRVLERAYEKEILRTNKQNSEIDFSPPQKKLTLLTN